MKEVSTMKSALQNVISTQNGLFVILGTLWQYSKRIQDFQRPVRDRNSKNQRGNLGDTLDKGKVYLRIWYICLWEYWADFNSGRSDISVSFTSMALTENILQKKTFCKIENNPRVLKWDFRFFYCTLKVHRLK